MPFCRRKRRRIIDFSRQVDWRNPKWPAASTMRTADSSNPGGASLGLVSFRQGTGPLGLDAPPPPGSPLEAARLGVGDEVLALDGRAVGDYARLEEALRRVRPGDSVSLRVRRRAGTGPDTVTVRAIEDPRVEIVAIESIAGTVTDEQRRFREEWLGARR